MNDVNLSNLSRRRFIAAAGLSAATAAEERVMKSKIAQNARTHAEPKAEHVVDPSQSPVRSVGVSEIHRFARYVAVFVLVPQSTNVGQVVPHKTSTAKPSSEPSERAKLIGVLGKTLQRIERNDARRSLAFGNVRVDFCAMEALRQGEPVLLTTKEFRTLEYLVQNAPRVISRDELLNEVWGYENYPCTRTVDNHILRLRQKLENDPSRPAHIRTMHGAGYKFLP
jgi:hypothetical protein